MIAIPRKKRIPLLRLFTENLIEKVKTYGVIKPLQFIHPWEPYAKKLAYMRSLPRYTVGHDLAKMLDARGLTLIPHFEKHDLKHLVLGYEMDTESELCMQAYLIGNGYLKLHCILFLGSGLLLPSLWKTLYAHFNKGRRSPSLSTLSFDDCLVEKTSILKQRYLSS